MKMSFTDFNCLFLERGQQSSGMISIYAPLIYNMKEDYFNAIVQYLQTGETTELSWRKFTIKDIMLGYGGDGFDYIDAVVLLNSLEISGDDCYTVWNPFIVE